MSGTKTTKSRALADEEMMLGVWEWAKACEADNPVIVTICLSPTDREGVFWVVAREHHNVDGLPRGLRRSEKVQWPSSGYATLAGAIMAAVALMDAAPIQEILPHLSASRS